MKEDMKENMKEQPNGKSLRDAYMDALFYLAEARPDLFFLDSGVGAACGDRFGRKYPERCMNFSAAEQNMVLTAAGRALAGRCVYAAAYSSLLVGRAYEQIRSSVALPKLPVHFASFHAGLTAGAEGATRQMLEDISLTRNFPGMAIFIPSDYTSARALLRETADLKGPSYTRLGRSERPSIYAPDDVSFRVGGGRILREGDQVTLCACGIMVGEALKAAEVLDQQDISAEVIDCYCLSPFPVRLVLSSLQRTGCCATAEEHFLPGGLFETVAGLTVREYPVPVQPVGIKSGFGQSGSTEDLREYYGLTAAQIVSAAVLAWTMRRR
ncbi:MAG: transketolase [Synergistaceae bacterium]|jgi:transketolase|nr:transketolase [Synergistaceae bacterium]